MDYKQITNKHIGIALWIIITSILYIVIDIDSDNIFQEFFAPLLVGVSWLTAIVVIGRYISENLDEKPFDN